MATNIFESYQNAILTPNNIAKNCVHQNPHLNPINPKKPYEQYNAQGELVGYYWYYGDTINLQFDIDGEITDIDGEVFISPFDYLVDKTIQFTLYNFRQEPIYITKTNKIYKNIITNPITKEEIEYVSVVFGIDAELSNKLIRGTYYCSLAILKDDILQITLFDPEDCTLLVK